MNSQRRQARTTDPGNPRIVPPRLWVLVLATVALSLLPTGAPAQPPAVPFDNSWNLPLNDEDRKDILEVARAVSEKSIRKIVIFPMLPLSIPLARVHYAEEVIGTFEVETVLMISKKDPAYWNQAHRASREIARGSWGTRRDELRRTVLRVFEIEGTRLRLEQADALSYREIEQVLQVIQRGAIIWDEQEHPPMAIPLAQVAGVGPSRTAGHYEISLPGRGSGYFLEVQLNGSRLIVKRVQMWVS
jgi:hypothetical protein